MLSLFFVQKHIKKSKNHAYYFYTAIEFIKNLTQKTGFF